MANPTTLLAHAIAEQSAVQSERNRALAASLTAEQDYATARAELNTATSNFVTLENEAAQIRKELAEVETPADGEALIAQLAAKIVALRTENAKILAAEKKTETARARSQLAGEELKRAETLLATAKADLAAATAAGEQRDARVAALGRAPLSTVRQEATDALNANPFLRAQTRINDDVPQPLRNRARARWQSEINVFDLDRQVVATADSLVATELNTNGGLVGKVEKLRAEYVRAADALRDYVSRARERYTLALGLAARVANTDNDPLTAAQSARIKDPALLADREDAADLENALDIERALVKTKESDVSKAILAALADDPEADPGTNQDVIDAREAQETAEEARDLAAAAYLPEHRATLDTWEAAVPDQTWQQFADFEESKRLLTELKNTSGQALVDNLNLAESALASALADAARSARTLRALETKRRASAASVEFEEAAAPRLTFSALRGDR